MDAIELLSQQHREVEKLFARVEGARKGGQAELFDELAEALRLHTFLEETIFYPGVRRAETSELVGDAFEDHDTVKRLLEDIEETGVAHQSFFSKLTALRDYVREHVREEESELFPKVRQLFSQDDLETMGRDLESSAEEWEQEDQGTTELVEPTPQTLQEPALDDTPLK